MFDVLRDVVDDIAIDHVISTIRYRTPCWYVLYLHYQYLNLK